MNLKRLAKNNSGATLLEITVMINFLIFIIFGTMEFTYYMYQSNSLTKAAQEGLRVATVSDPAVGIYTDYCPGATSEVSCTGGSCSAANFNQIYIVMKKMAPFLSPSDVTVSYINSGLGFCSTDGTNNCSSNSGVKECVPTISIKINRKFDSLFGLIKNLYLPRLQVTRTGEDLNSYAPT